MTNHGTLFIISAPSGAGKTSLVKALLERMTSIQASVSHTTRPQREGEVDGQHYHFVSESTFNELCAQGVFLEHAQVFKNFYGTSAQTIKTQLQSGIDVILEIDWQGAQQVRQQIANTCCIFILPPSVETLQQRLIKRGQDKADTISSRMQEATQEISHFSEYDYLIINDDFDSALEELTTIIKASRLKLHIQHERHNNLISALLDS